MDFKEFEAIMRHHVRDFAQRQVPTGPAPLACAGGVTCRSHFALLCAGRAGAVVMPGRRPRRGTWPPGPASTVPWARPRSLSRMPASAAAAGPSPPLPRERAAHHALTGRGGWCAAGRRRRCCCSPRLSRSNLRRARGRTARAASTRTHSTAGQGEVPRWARPSIGACECGSGRWFEWRGGRMEVSPFPPSKP